VFSNPIVTVNKSARAEGPFIRISFRDFFMGGGLLHATIHSDADGRGCLGFLFKSLYH
jgi:hypothetical protein